MIKKNKNIEYRKKLSTVHTKKKKQEKKTVDSQLFVLDCSLICQQADKSREKNYSVYILIVDMARA